MLSFEFFALSRGSKFDAIMTAIPKEQMWQLSLEIEGRSYSALGWDCLDAFNKIRTDLEGRYAFLCNGARPNFILSPMTSHAGGFEGYMVPNGRKARLSDLVPIFDPAPADEIGSVEAQSQFRKNYMDQVQRGELSD
jgi:hypothetical protein